MLDFLQKWELAIQTEASLWGFFSRNGYPELWNLSLTMPKLIDSPRPPWKMEIKLTALYGCCLRLFHSMRPRYWASNGKVRRSQTKCCARHARSSWLEDLHSKMQPLPGNFGKPPGWQVMRLLYPARRHASSQILFQCPPAIPMETACLAHFWQSTESIAPATLLHKTTLESTL